MISLIFEELDGEKIMLPVMGTAFEEKKAEDGTPYVVAYFDQQQWALKTTLNEIQHMCAQAMRPQLTALPPGHHLRGI